MALNCSFWLGRLGYSIFFYRFCVLLSDNSVDQSRGRIYGLLGLDNGLGNWEWKESNIF